MIQVMQGCFRRAHIGHRLHLTYPILLKIQFMRMTRLKSLKWSENNVEAHSSQIYIFFQMFKWSLNEDHQMRRSCLNMQSSIENYKDELLNKFYILSVTSNIDHRQFQAKSLKVEGGRGVTPWQHTPLIIK